MGLWYCKKDDIMSLKENQATPKVAFGFLGSFRDFYPNKKEDFLCLHHTTELKKVILQRPY